MPDRRILVFDDVGTLLPVVEQALAQYRFEVVACRTLERLVQQLAERRPCLVLFAAEAPKRSGFGAFTRARLACGHPLPMILCSATLPRAELDMHAKQRWHAQAYLDAAALTPESLRRCVSSLVRLGSRKANRDHAVRRKRVRASAPRRHPTAEESDSRDERWIAQLLSDLDREATAATAARDSVHREAPRPEADASESEASARIEAELGHALQENARLRVELADARRYASTSPFSDTFTQLQAQLEGREAELRTLRAELAEARRELSGYERRLRLLAEKLLSAERRSARRLPGPRDSTGDADPLQKTQADVSTLAQRHAAEMAALRAAHSHEISGLLKRFEEQREAERREFETELQTLEALLSLERDPPPGREPEPETER